MRNILIIYPHWVPSNLAGVHRPRLVANYFEEFGWHPILLTVDPEQYEEAPDWDMLRTASSTIEVVHVGARSVGKLRLIGDIGLRAWEQLGRAALKLIENRKIEFVWIPIPSFYMAILGRRLHEKTGVPYGIDYIDPWVRDISGRKNWRSVISLWIARLLEPYAVKKAALISGVSKAYYEPVMNRNFSTSKQPISVAFPYGFDPNDHAIQLDTITLPWPEEVKMPLIYAGAFLPNSRLFITYLFKAVRKLKDQGQWPEQARLYFIGTGNYPGKSIADYARENGIAELVKEDRSRKPFLQVLNFLARAFAVMVVGSTEKHYTASKTYQAVLSKNPVLAMFHQESTAIQVLKEAQADAYLFRWQESKPAEESVAEVAATFSHLFEGKKENWSPKLEAMMKYSSRHFAQVLLSHVEQALKKKKTT